MNGCGDAVVLAWRTPGPDAWRAGDARDSQGEGPSTETGEEMALSISGKIICSNILDAPFVNVAWRYVSGGNKVAQPLGHERVYFVVVRRLHGSRKQKARSSRRAGW
ncbi:hypothetical protein [Comamonas thiooxydans]|uniref:hypothetical protein n=1 Tax=Comamonas thiooxydans TaxID=363952 RepID=UPI003D068D2A